MDSVDVTKVLIVRSSFTSMEENMKANVSKGGCEASGHWGIKSDGTIGMGEGLPSYSYKSSAPLKGALKILLLGEVTDLTWEALDYVVAMNSLMLPVSGVTSSDPELRVLVEERYG